LKKEHTKTPPEKIYSSADILAGRSPAAAQQLSPFALGAAQQQPPKPPAIGPEVECVDLARARHLAGGELPDDVGLEFLNREVVIAHTRHIIASVTLRSLNKYLATIAPDEMNRRRQAAVLASRGYTMPAAPPTLTQRVAALQAEVAQLKQDH
jgi:hypothetical protein